MCIRDRPRTAGAPPRVPRASPDRSARSAARFAEGAEAGCLLPAVHEASGRSRTSRSIASEKHDETKDQSKQPASAPSALRAALRADLSGDARGTRGSAHAVSRSDGGQDPGGAHGARDTRRAGSWLAGGAVRGEVRRVACPTGSRHRLRSEPRARAPRTDRAQRKGPRGARHASPEALRPAACCRPSLQRALSLFPLDWLGKCNETIDPRLSAGRAYRALLPCKSLRQPRSVHSVRTQA